MDGDQSQTDVSGLRANLLSPKETNMEPISACVRRRRLRWLGHVLRLPNNSLARVALRWTPQGEAQEGQAQNNMAEICGGGPERRGTNMRDCQ